MSGRIFISYRRADSQWAAARLYDTLRLTFPDDEIFMDVAEIAPGQDFVKVLEREVGGADVFLALIGPEWLSMQQADGDRRLDDEADFVRIEIAAALRKPGTLTIPVLLDGAAPPEEDTLPEDLKPIARRQFARLSHEGFQGEIGRLVDAITGALARPATAAPPPPTAKPPLAKIAGGVLGAALVAGLVWFGYDRLSRPADPSGGADLSAFVECEECPEMIILPGGAFMMGSPEEEQHRSASEGPQRRVTIPRFAVARTETTWAAYAACAAAEACQRLPDDGSPKDGLPATTVRWVDAQSFAAWLNTLVPGEPYRLLTESEWEYAARGGTTTAYYWGGEPDRAYANMGREVCCIGSAEGPDKWKGVAPVAQFKPNAFGLYDMLGNQAEWVEDVYRSDMENSPTDGGPRIWISDSPWAQRHVVRGGSFSDRPWNARSASRQSNDKHWLNFDYGFRVARDLTPR
ncbi:MAG: SUMF1/EgtB/PvdO family nonheme iron enzyme [Pseudomonadota bacterium]